MTTTPRTGFAALQRTRTLGWTPLVLGAVLSVGSAAALAQPAQSMEERLRAQLRITTTQLQQAQNELAVLKAGTMPVKPAAAAAPAAPAADVAELRQALARAQSQLSAERQGRVQAGESSQQLRAQAQAATDKASAQVGQYRNAYDELLKIARASEAERQRLGADAALQRTAVAQCEARNTQLYAVGQEILRAYETVDLGSVLASRQPFAAQSRVKYEQIAQQYGDKLYEGRFDARSASVPPAADKAETATPK